MYYISRKTYAFQDEEDNTTESEGKKKMTLYDLLKKDLITDKDVIRVVKPCQGNIFDMRRGHWFNDQILDVFNQEITEFSWNKDQGWTIGLVASDINLSFNKE